MNRNENVNLILNGADWSNRSGYQMFSQELLTNGELNHFSLKERMVEIGKRWHKLSQGQKDKYKKLVEEQQVEYKAELEAWVKVRGPVLYQ